MKCVICGAGKEGKNVMVVCPTCYEYMRINVKTTCLYVIKSGMIEWFPLNKDGSFIELKGALEA